MADRFDPPRDHDWKSLPMRPDIAGQYVRYSDLAAAQAEIERLTKYRDADHANINLKADFIEATINQLALAEAERDEALAQVAAALEAAADTLQDVADNWDCGHMESRLCDCARDAEQWGFAADEVRSLIPADAKAALAQKGASDGRDGYGRGPRPAPAS